MVLEGMDVAPLSPYPSGQGELNSQCSWPGSNPAGQRLFPDFEGGGRLHVDLYPGGRRPPGPEQWAFGDKLWRGQKEGLVDSIHRGVYHISDI